MKPLWVEFPHIPWGSIGWRMGWGEDYWVKWSAFFLALDSQDRDRYRNAWPEPEPWSGLYAFIETGLMPEGAEEHRRKLAGPHSVPDADEMTISDYYRTVWLIRRYMTPLGLHDVPARFPTPDLGKAPDEEHVNFYSEPNGAWWRLSCLKVGGMLLHRLTRAAEPDRLLFGNQ